MSVFGQTTSARCVSLFFVSFASNGALAATCLHTYKKSTCTDMYMCVFVMFAFVSYESLAVPCLHTHINRPNKCAHTHTCMYICIYTHIRTHTKIHAYTQVVIVQTPGLHEAMKALQRRRIASRMARLTTKMRRPYYRADTEFAGEVSKELKRVANMDIDDVQVQFVLC